MEESLRSTLLTAGQSSFSSRLFFNDSHYHQHSPQTSCFFGAGLPFHSPVQTPSLFAPLGDVTGKASSLRVCGHKKLGPTV